jgi:hypothetical protein
MKNRILPVSVLVATLAGSAAAQTYTLTPLTSFAGDGWLAPAEGGISYVTTGNTERGLAYNNITGNLVLVSRAGGNNIRVLDGDSGADVGALNNTGITGGTFAVNMVGISDEGAIYVGNLSTSAAANFKVYKWASESDGLTTAPTVAYDGLSGLARTGDSFAVQGAGASAQFAAAGTTATSASSFAVGTLNGSNAGVSYLSVPGTATASNDYRLSLEFVDADTLIGNQGTNGRLTDFNGATARVAYTVPLAATQRALDYAVIGGVPYLAVLDSNSSLLSIYDVSNPASPALAAAGTTTSGTLTSNANGTGTVTWGDIAGNTATVYAMNSNQGIQAMTFTVVPEPEEYAMMAAGGLIAFGVWRRFRR